MPRFYIQENFGCGCHWPTTFCLPWCNNAPKYPFPNGYLAQKPIPQLTWISQPTLTCQNSKHSFFRNLTQKLWCFGLVAHIGCAVPPPPPRERCTAMTFMFCRGVHCAPMLPVVPQQFLVPCLRLQPRCVSGSTCQCALQPHVLWLSAASITPRSMGAKHCTPSTVQVPSPQVEAHCVRNVSRQMSGKRPAHDRTEPQCPASVRAPPKLQGLGLTECSARRGMGAVCSCDSEQ